MLAIRSLLEKQLRYALGSSLALSFFLVSYCRTASLCASALRRGDLVINFSLQFSHVCFFASCRCTEPYCSPWFWSFFLPLFVADNMSARSSGHFDSWAKLVEQDGHGLHGAEIDTYLMISPQDRVKRQSLRASVLDRPTAGLCSSRGGGERKEVGR